MAGMMTEGLQGQTNGEQSKQAPSSGPAQTPPSTAPGAGTSPRGSAPGPEQPAGNVEAARDEAIKLIYGERFDSLIKMFETNGAEQFPRSMAVAINTALSEVEKRMGGMDYETAAEVGMDLMMKLLEDIVVEGILPDVTVEQISEVMPATLMMYADSHPEVSKQDIQQVMASAQQGVQGQQNAPPTGPDQAPIGNQVAPEPAQPIEGKQ